MARDIHVLALIYLLNKYNVLPSRVTSRHVTQVSTGFYCSKKEQTQNPNAVINALKTYENSIRYKAKGNKKYMVAESMEDITEGSESGSARSSTSGATEPASPAADDTAAAAAAKSVLPAGGAGGDTVDKTVLPSSAKQVRVRVQVLLAVPV